MSAQISLAENPLYAALCDLPSEPNVNPRTGDDNSLDNLHVLAQKCLRQTVQSGNERIDQIGEALFLQA